MDTSKSHSFYLEADGVGHFLMAASAEEKQSWLDSITRVSAGSSHLPGAVSPPSSRCSSGSSSGSASHWNEVFVASTASGPSLLASQGLLAASEDEDDSGIKMLADVERKLTAGELPSSEAAAAVARVLESAKDPSERTRAAKALGMLALSSPVVVASTLPLALVTERDPDVRAEVALAIGVVGEGIMGRSGRCTLERTTADVSMKVRAAAAQALFMDGWLELLD